MMDTLLIPVVIVVALLVLAVAAASIYRTVSADQAMIVTGITKDGMKVVKAGGTVVIPIVQRAEFLSLRVNTIDVRTPEVYTEQGVPVMVDGVAQIKIKGDIESIKTAAEQFLGKTDDELRLIATETLEGHLRAILGQMTVEEIYKNRDKFAQQVQEVAATDFAKMGLQIVSFTIKDVKDNNGYLAALGRPQIAAVRRNAEIAEADAERDERIKKAAADQEGQKAELLRDTAIAEATKDKELKVAAYKREQDQAKAQADMAYELQAARSKQDVTKEEMEIKIVEKQKLIELEEQEIIRREKQYDAEVKKKADADRYSIEQAAEAEKAKAMREADAQKYQIQAQASADAEKVRVTGLANAEKTRAEGTAEAEVIRLRGFAEAEAKDKLAEAMKKYGEAAMAEMLINKFPEIASAISAPLAQTEKIVIVDNGGDGKGAAKVTGYVTDILASLPETVGALTNVDLTKMLQNFSEKKETAIVIDEVEKVEKVEKEEE